MCQALWMLVLKQTSLRVFQLSMPRLNTPGTHLHRGTLLKPEEQHIYNQVLRGLEKSNPPLLSLQTKK